MDETTDLEKIAEQAKEHIAEAAESLKETASPIADAARPAAEAARNDAKSEVSRLHSICVTDQFKTGQWLSNQNQPLLWLIKGLR
ncbi:MAG TPA: hypothetical protein VN957_12485 [Chthoniobacterales bacterium]|nr:hypothetical protein [Chthoniobacterales bacterium]